MVVLDMSRPWLIMESLDRWFGVLDDHLATLDCEDELASLKSNMVKYFQSFTEDEDTPEETSTADGEDGDDADVDIPLEDGVLISNNGIPVIVCVNKVQVLVPHRTLTLLGGCCHSSGTRA